MARPKKDGRRATGIQGKKGFLYIVISQSVIKDGVKKTEKHWIATGLTDTPDNVKRAIEARNKLLSNSTVSTADRNVSLFDYTDCVLEKKKREVSNTTFSAYFYRAKRIKDFFGDTKVKDINEVMVEAFLDQLFETHQEEIMQIVRKKLSDYLNDEDLCNDEENMFPRRCFLTGEWYVSELSSFDNEPDVFFSVQTAFLGTDLGCPDDYLGLEVNLYYDESAGTFLTDSINSEAL